MQTMQNPKTCPRSDASYEPVSKLPNYVPNAISNKWFKRSLSHNDSVAGNADVCGIMPIEEVFNAQKNPPKNESEKAGLVCSYVKNLVTGSRVTRN
jgi:hypothetical protein